VGFSRGTQFACRYNVWDEVECNVFAISPTLEVRQASDVKPGVRLFPQALKARSRRRDAHELGDQQRAVHRDDAVADLDKV
jgi:hypothetical protein